MNKQTMPEYKLKYAGIPVEVYICRDDNWQHDYIFFWSESRSISDREINKTIQYLYDEGYIKDRRTRYEIINDRKK